MEGAQIGLLVTRFFLLLSACVVLGLSANLTDKIHTLCDEAYGHPDCIGGNVLSSVEYGVFVGVWGLIQVVVGFVAVFARLPWIAVIVVDGLAWIFYLAGGIDIAVLISNHGGCNIGSGCTQLKADEAFMWIGWIFTIAAIVLVFLWQRKR